MKSIQMAVALAATAVLSAGTLADTISVTADGIGTISMNSGDMGDVLSNNTSVFKGSDLSTIHESLHSSGISTDGFVTVLFAETAQGLSMMSLVDDNTLDGSGDLDSTLGFSTTIANTDANLYVNDLIQDMDNHEVGPDGQSASGDFLWRGEGNGDALAWAGMEADDAWSVSFFDNGESSEAVSGGFQFLSWNGDEWEVIATAGGFGEGGVFTFSGTVVPLPAALGMGLAGLAAVGLRRRRMRSIA